MEVNFTPEIERKLSELAAQSGMTADELVRDAVAGMFDELAEALNILDRRYDDLKSGRVKGIPGEKALRYFREKHGAALPQPVSETRGKEKARAFEQWAKGHPYTPPLSDEAISRASMNPDRG
jgi:hypothetical protein